LDQLPLHLNLLRLHTFDSPLAADDSIDAHDWCVGGVAGGSEREV
jgi:hypothetical protein